MNVVRWDPFAEVNTLFNRLMPGGRAGWPQLGSEGNGSRAFEWSPSADISETEKEYVIRAELPAVRKEDVHVTLGEGVVTIKGERKQQKEEKSEKFHRVENFYGNFERSFSLPDNVIADAVKCESRDGILTVHLPKSEMTKQKARQITVQ